MQNTEKNSTVEFESSSAKSDDNSVSEDQKSQVLPTLRKQKSNRDTLVILSPINFESVKGTSFGSSTYNPGLSQTSVTEDLKLSSGSGTSNVMYNHRETEIMKEIFSFLSRYPSILKDMFSWNAEAVDDLCECFLSMSFVTSTVMKLFQFFIGDELANFFTATHVENITKDQSFNPANFIHDTSIAGKLLKLYLNRVANNYLYEILSDFVTQIVVSERKVSLEMNPSFTEPEELENNRKMLIKKISTVIDRVTSKESIDKMPVGLRVILGFVRDNTAKYTSSSTVVSFIMGTFIFARFLNVGLISPDTQSLIPKGKAISNTSKRNLVLISKVLQNMFMGTSFGAKEQFLVCLNDFMNSKKEVISNYLSNVALPATTVVPIGSEFNVVTVKDLQIIHRMLFQKRDQITSLLPPSNPQEFSKLLDKLGSFQSKMSFSLSAADRKMVQGVLDERGEEASLIVWVEKRKKNKLAKRLLVVTMNRVLSIKSNGKVGREGHILDLVEIKSLDSKDIELIFKTFSMSAVTDQADDIITCIRNTYEIHFSCFPESLRIRLTVEPNSRLLPIVGADELPCGGFLGCYVSLCNFYNCLPNSDLCWDMDHNTTNSTTFDLSKWTSEFSADSLKEMDLLPIFHALRYNKFFTHLIIKNFKFEKKEVVQSIAEICRYNTTLSALTLSKITIGSSKETGFGIILDCLNVNPGNCISYIDLSHSSIEDKGMLSLSNFLANTSNSLIHLNIENTGCSSKSLAAVLVSLKENPKSASMESFDLSNNKLGQEGCIALGQYLSHSSSKSLRKLLVANSASGLLSGILSNLLANGCPLRHLDLSHNKLAKVDELTPLVEYLKKSTTLETLNLCGIQSQSSDSFDDVMAQILVSASNDLNLMVNLGDCNMGLSSAKIISKIAYKMNNISILDLSDNDFGDEGAADLFQGLRNNYTIKQLYLNRVMKGNNKAKIKLAIDNLIKLISSESAIEGLHISAKPHHSLKNDLLPFVTALASNSTITELTMSGHQMGNAGAVALAKTLQTNEALTKLWWDGNQTGIVGFKNIKYALKINKTLKYMPLPVSDIAEQLQLNSSPEFQKKLQSTLTKIEKAILFNQKLNQQ
mmetsp:Transcript_22688/g.31592  ORF Transcript_22688/g.31592 Transcript_22688/m.31592 type:complete len:1101 (-) Transcript_22688:27-3329(-)